MGFYNIFLASIKHFSFTLKKTTRKIKKIATLIYQVQQIYHQKRSLLQKFLPQIMYTDKKKVHIIFKPIHFCFVWNLKLVHN